MWQYGSGLLISLIVYRATDAEVGLFYVNARFHSALVAWNLALTWEIPTTTDVQPVMPHDVTTSDL